MSLADWACVIAVAAICGAAVAHARRYAGTTIDDAFITYRHALNLVRGHGFTCNIGERIEGTSSPLFALAMVLPIAVGADPYGAAAWFGTAAFAGCVVLAYAMVRVCLHDGASRVLGLGAAALVAASPNLAFHSQTGLETLPYAFTVLLTLALHARTTLGDRDSVAWAWVGGIAALLRPEGVFLFPMLWLLDQLRRPTSVRQRTRSRRAVQAFCLVFGPWLLFRMLYFGQTWPNSVTAKSGTMDLYLGMPLARALSALMHGPGIEAVTRFGREHLHMTLATAGCLMLSRTRWLAARIGLLVAMYVALISWNGGDWMPHDRLLTPCITPLCVAAALGTRGFLFHDEQRTKLGHLPSYVLACALFVVGTRTAFRPLAGGEIALTDKQKIREIGERLGALALKQDLVASELAGVLPYYWQAPTVDMFGICDAHIARTGDPQQFGVGKTAPEYVAAKRPTFYAFGSLDNAATFFASAAFAPYREEYHLLQYPYAYTKTFKAGAPPALLVRKDRPELPRLEQELGVRLLDAGQELRRTGYIR